MEKKFFILMLVIVLFFFPNTVLAARGNGAINGFVKDHFGEPIKDVQVKIKHSRFTSKTNGKGKYVIKYIPGTFTVIYSKEGYSKHEITLSLSTKDEFPIEDVSLIKLPENPGVYLYNKGQTTTLRENKIGIAGTFLQSISGIKTLSDTHIIDNKPSFLIYGDKFPLENIQLDRLTFTGYAMVQNITGKTSNEINMWTLGGKATFKLIKYSAEQNIGVVKITSPLEPGAYALSWGGLHSGDPLTASMSKKFVFDFEVLNTLVGAAQKRDIN